MVDKMVYRDGYKYQLAAAELFKTSFRPANTIRAERIALSPDGTMIVSSGFCWDGASGIVDRKTNIRASCGHDALYQLMRRGHLDHNEWLKADDDFCRWLEEAGAWSITVSLDRWGLRQMGGKYARPEHKKQVYIV
jgi:hypothetical protein